MRGLAGTVRVLDLHTHKINGTGTVRGLAGTVRGISRYCEGISRYCEGD